MGEISDVVGFLLLGHYSDRFSYWIGCEAVGKEGHLPGFWFEQIEVLLLSGVGTGLEWEIKSLFFDMLCI